MNSQKIVGIVVALLVVAIIVPLAANQFFAASDPTLSQTDEFVAANDAVTAESFTLSFEPVTDSETVTVNGVEIVETTDYTITGTSLDLDADASDVGDDVVATYDYVSTSPDMISTIYDFIPPIGAAVIIIWMVRLMIKSRRE